MGTSVCSHSLQNDEKNQNVSWKGTINREVNSVCNLLRGHF